MFNGDFDVLVAVGALSSFRANLPSGPLGPVPLVDGSCSNVLTGLQISLR